MGIKWEGFNAFLEIMETKRFIGFLNSENNFVAINYTYNFFNKFKGWGLSEELVFDLMSRSIPKIILQIKESKINEKIVKLLVATTDVWMEKGHRIHEEGFERQIILEEGLFDKVMENKGVE